MYQKKGVTSWDFGAAASPPPAVPKRPPIQVTPKAERFQSALGAVGIENPPPTKEERREWSRL